MSPMHCGMLLPQCSSASMVFYCSVGNYGMLKYGICQMVHPDVNKQQRYRKGGTGKGEGGGREEERDEQTDKEEQRKGGRGNRVRGRGRTERNIVGRGSRTERDRSTTYSVKLSIGRQIQ